MSRADFALLQVLELHIKSITAADRRAALCAVAARLRVLARRDAQRVDIVLP